VLTDLRNQALRPLATLALAGTALVLASACEALTSGPTETEERADTYSGVSSLVVNHQIGSVTITAGDTLEVSRSVRKTTAKSPSERIEKSGDTLEVGAGCPPSLGSDTCAVDYRITAPPTVRVKVEAGANPVLVSGFTKPVEVTTDSGAIELDRVHADVRATTKAGNVTIGKGSGRIQAKSDSGSMAIRLGSGPLTASATSGNIKVTVPGDRPCHVTAKARSGKTEIDVKQSAGGVPIDVTTDSGNITVTADRLSPPAGQ
jgi:hypothetical protein